MTVSRPAIVLTRLGREALVQSRGRNLLVSSELVDDLHVGDRVLVTDGLIVAKVSAQEAAALEAAAQDGAGLEGRPGSGPGAVAPLDLDRRPAVR